MTSLYWIFGICVLVLIVSTVFIPTTRSATKETIFDTDIEHVWAVYTDFSSQPEWRDEVASVEFGDNGKEWVETLKTGNIKIHIKVVEFVPPNRLVLKTSSPNRFEGLYTAEFESIQNGTEGTFTESSTTLGLVAKIVPFFFVDPEKIIDKYAEDAKREIQRRLEN